MKMPSVTGLNHSPVQCFLESSWQGKAVRILGTIAFISLIYYVASRFISNKQTPAAFQGRGVTNETPVVLPPWLREINENTWKETIDCKKYGLDFTGVPRINGPALAKSLEALSECVENNRGITNMVIPKGLTLNIVLQIADKYKVPISTDWFNQIKTQLGDIPTEQTCVLFFTNSILTGTGNHTSGQHDADINAIEKKCGVTIQKPNVRDFMAFLVLTYLSSPKDDRMWLYSSAYTRLLEEVEGFSLYGGFDSSGLRAVGRDFSDHVIGVGASGSSQY
jgi:hypothetical protein